MNKWTFAQKVLFRVFFLFLLTQTGWSQEAPRPIGQSNLISDFSTSEPLNKLGHIIETTQQAAVLESLGSPLNLRVEGLQDYAGKVRAAFGPNGNEILLASKAIIEKRVVEIEEGIRNFRGISEYQLEKLKEAKERNRFASSQLDFILAVNSGTGRLEAHLESYLARSQRMENPLPKPPQQKPEKRAALRKNFEGHFRSSESGESSFGNGAFELAKGAKVEMDFADKDLVINADFVKREKEASVVILGPHAFVRSVQKPSGKISVMSCPKGGTILLRKNQEGEEDIGLISCKSAGKGGAKSHLSLAVDSAEGGVRTEQEFSGGAQTADPRIF